MSNVELRNKFNIETKGGGSDADYIAWLEEKLSRPHYSVESEHLDELLSELNGIAQFMMRSEENADDLLYGLGVMYRKFESFKSK